jgi:hypothetical protein
MSSWKLVEAEVMHTSDVMDGTTPLSGSAEDGERVPGEIGGYRDKRSSSAPGAPRGGPSYRHSDRNSDRRAYRDQYGGYRRQGRGSNVGHNHRGGYNYQGVFIPDTPETRAYNVAVAMQFM